MNITDISACALSSMIKKGEISIKEAIDAYYAVIDEKEKNINAYITLTREEAYEQAVAVQKRIDSGEDISPLAGVPVAVKDNICTRGIKTTAASRILSNFVPEYDAEVSAKIKNAGMIIIGKANMDEFAMGSTTETSYFGITRNPANTEHVPGGSSGGSCAAVAAKEACIALGSDTGGSIRQPASYCGVTGIKPTYGGVSRYGLIAYGSSLDQIGPIGKNVEDCAALLSVISGKDKKDSTSASYDDNDFLSGLGDAIKGLKVGMPAEYYGEGIQPEVKNAACSAADALRDLGAEVSEFNLGMLDYAVPAYYVIASAEASSNLERFDGVKYGYRAGNYEGLHDMYKKSRSEGFGTEVKRRIMLGTFVLSSGYYDAYYLKALRTKALIKQSFDEAFSKYDVILAPVAPTTAPKIGEMMQDPIRMYLSDIYTVSVNLAGLPGVVIPCGEDDGGMPVGVQLIGNCFSDKLLLKTAYSLEQKIKET